MSAGSSAWIKRGLRRFFHPQGKSQVSHVTYKITKETVEEGLRQTIDFNRLKPYCVLKFQRSSRTRQTRPKTFHDESGTEAEEEHSKELAYGCDDDRAREIVLRKSGFCPDSNQSYMVLENFLNDSDDCAMLFLVDLITKRLQAGRISLNCITKEFSGCKIEELQRKTTRTKPRVLKLVAVCIATNDLLSARNTLEEMSDTYRELPDEIQQRIEPERVYVCTLPPIESPVEQFKSMITDFNLELR